MPARPIQRWKTFWLGVLVLVFLAWSWMVSMTNPGFIGVAVPGVNGGAGYTNGSVILFCNGSSDGFGIGFFNEPVEAEPMRFPSGIEFQFSKGKPIHLNTSTTLANGAARKSYTCGYSPAHSHVRVAHWLFIPIFALLWSTVLFSRHRRMKRLVAET
jgi:hypothetical protein